MSATDDGLCQDCRRSLVIDDASDEFCEGVDEEGQPVLRHVREDGNRSIRLSAIRRWDDTAPEFPAMATDAGCRLCAMVRTALVRRQVDLDGPATVLAAYVWGGNRDVYMASDADDGLVYLRCEVFPRGTGPPACAFVVFRVEVADADVSAWLRTDGPRETRPLAPDNIAWIADMLASWDDDPDKRHSAGFVPTRLIRVGSDDAADRPRLEQTAAWDAPRRYAALSYCWGPPDDAAQQLCTTTATLADHLEPNGPAWAAWTPVLRDALVVCRALAIPYLWADAVCIVQDDRDDWARESAVMGRVYFHAYLTICPLASGSCLQGFLAPRPPGVDVPFRSARRPAIRGALTLVESYNDQDNAALQKRWAPQSFDVSAPLYQDRMLSQWETRGWTFQESYCSSRTLYFGPSMLHLASPISSLSETGFLETGSGVSGPFRELMQLAEDMSDDDDNNNSNDDIWTVNSPQECAISIWNSMTTIGGRRFTRPDDFLPAISGLAAAYHRIHRGDLYLAGLWRRCLHLQLLWHMPQPPVCTLAGVLEVLQNTFQPYVAPSWSWARIALHLYFEMLAPVHYAIPGTIEDSKKTFTTVQYGLTHLCPAFSLVGHRLDLAGPNPYGQLHHASLRLRARLCPLPAPLAMHPGAIGRLPLAYFAAGRGTALLDWQAEAPTTLVPDLPLRLLLTTTCCQATTNAVLRFIANPDEDHEDGLADRPIYPDEMTPNSDDTPAQESAICLSCHDPQQPPNAMGLVVHPADVPGTFYRVGVFVLFGHAGVFDGVDQEITLV